MTETQLEREFPRIFRYLITVALNKRFDVISKDTVNQ